MKIHIWGLGAVAKASLITGKRTGEISLADVYAVDILPAAREAFVTLGGNPDHFRLFSVKRDNLEDLFEPVSAGDIVFSLGVGFPNRTLFKMCLDRNVHFISTCADDFVDGDFEKPSFALTDFRAYQKLFSAAPSNAATSVINIGMNPGLVSLYAKRAICELAGEEPTNYAETARRIGVERIVVSDVDDSVYTGSIEPGIIYSTWAPYSFAEETALNAEVTVGCGVPSNYLTRPFVVADESSGYRTLANRSYHEKARSIGLKAHGVFEDFEGFVVTHDEIVSIPNYLTVCEGGKVVYRPEALFVYHPCDAARHSVETILAAGHTPTGYHLITRDEISTGGESVGVVVSGKKCGRIYVGTRFEINEVPLGTTPTVLQVVGGCRIALRHILEHPNAGPLMPEHLPVSALSHTSLPLIIKRSC